jgi:hypothetical protein
MITAFRSPKKQSERAADQILHFLGMALSKRAALGRGNSPQPAAT